ncbi:MAG: fibronectin type III domain-containing protein [Pirellulales bacterium]|nr:fibronectin type III domain-containing protein [Pirellulales bacterium]
MKRADPPAVIPKRRLAARALSAGILAWLLLTFPGNARAESLAARSEQHISADQPYDGAGRYALQRDDGIRGRQGLTELASRFGAKPYKILALSGDVWQSERVIFRDVDTGAAIVRLTNDPWADELSYFKGNWSADGQYIVFRRRPGMWESSTPTHGPMAVRSDGTGLRNVMRDYAIVRKYVCSPTEPDVCYALADEQKVVAFDLKTGHRSRVICQTHGCWHLKISPDGKYLMGRADLNGGGRGLWIVSSDGREHHEISVPESIHDSYQFHPAQRKVMFWYEDRFRKEGFVQCDFDGKQWTKVPVQFDWNHGDVGPDRGVHADGHITRIRGNAWLPDEPLFDRTNLYFYDDPADCNGYLAWRPKSQPWVCATRIVAPPFLSEIQCFSAEPVADGVVNRYRVCYSGLKRGAALDNPDVSPDGTKVLFNSNMLGRVDVYYAVLGLPRPPGDLKLRRAPDGARLAWTPPRYHAEIAGYRVYRSRRSGIGYVPIARLPARTTEFVDRNAAADSPAFYAVSSIEHSGLESSLSEERCSDSAAGGKRRLFLEAESGKRNPKVWTALQGSASDAHYVWMRAGEGAGEVALNLTMPKTERPCIVWGRVKGEKGVNWTASAQGRSVTLTSPPSTTWRWVKFTGTLDVPPGRCNLVLASSLYRSALDVLVLTDDPAFLPDETRRIDWPAPTVVQGLKASVTSPYSVQLTWQSDESELFHHYNLYCGETADVTPDQSALVASPDANVFHDWGLKPGRTLFYRLTTVDYGGNESAPSPPVKVVLPGIQTVVLQKTPAEKIDFQVPADGVYVLWLKLKRNVGGNPYINLAIDQGPTVTWTCQFDELSDESWLMYGPWARWGLTAGKHTLSLNNDTKHVIEAVLITNDFSYQPNGHVNILNGW